MEYPHSVVRRNNSNGQKLLTVPKNSDIQPGDSVRLVNLGRTWEGLPAYLQVFNNIEHLIWLVTKADNPLELNELDEVSMHLEEAGEALSNAKKVIEENRNVYSGISTEELQEECMHDRIEREEEEWRCVNCKKIFSLDI